MLTAPSSGPGEDMSQSSAPSSPLPHSAATCEASQHGLYDEPPMTVLPLHMKPPCAEQRLQLPQKHVAHAEQSLPCGMADEEEAHSDKGPPKKQQKKRQVTDIERAQVCSWYVCAQPS